MRLPWERLPSVQDRAGQTAFRDDRSPGQVKLVIGADISIPGMYLAFGLCVLLLNIFNTVIKVINRK